MNGENPFFVKELETGIVVLGWNQHFYGYTIFMCIQKLFNINISNFFMRSILLVSCNEDTKLA